MKTYLRLLSYARPIGKFALPFCIFSFLSIVFGIINFTLLIPVLNVLFGTVSSDEAKTMMSKPDFTFGINYFVRLFNYYFSLFILQNGKMGALKFVCGIIVASVFLSNIFKYLTVRILEGLRAYTVANLRESVFSKALTLHLGYFSNERKGNIISRLTSDVQEVEYSIANSFTVAFREPVTLIGYFVALFMLSAKLTLFTLLVIPVSGLVIAGIVKRLRKSAREGQESLSRLLSILDETFGGMRVVMAFNAADYLKEKFNLESRRYKQIILSIAKKRELSSPFSEFTGVFVVVGILLYGGSLVLSNQSELNAAQFITYIAIFSQVLRPAKEISNAFSNIQRGLAAGERIFTIVDTDSAIQNKPSAVSISSFRENIEFRNVWFAYEKDNWILKNINITIPKGSTVALVGPSGGGKSTFADMIPRFYDPSKGQILIDGNDLRDCQIESIRRQMGIVTQESILFNDTIYNNITFGREASQEEVITAAKIANAHNFIIDTADGYQTMIGDRGTKLSGGQRQRLSIARAILKNPPILILDEATSALDTESEKLVQEALINLMKNRTSIVIAHRLSTIQNADRILVIQNGEIVEQGNHDYLLGKENGVYKRLSLMQSI